MMLTDLNAIQSFQAPPTWSEECGLPLVPFHNNPFIYGAYAIKIIRLHDKIDPLDPSPESNYAWMRENWERYLKDTEIEPGFFNRWPKGRGGLTSHDEVMGRAWLCPKEASKILAYLEKHDGLFANVDIKSGIPERENIYRFYWLKPFLKACTIHKDNPDQHRVSLISQLIWSWYALMDGMFYKKEENDGGGRARMWLMLDKMEKLPLSNIFVQFWRNRMKKLGISPKTVFSELYLKEAPQFAAFAPEEF